MIKAARYIPLLACGAVVILAGCQGQMRDQIDVQPQRQPLILPATDSVPMQGYEAPVTMPAGPTGGPANPVPASAMALANGAHMFAVDCAPCHGAAGKGDGKVGELFVPRPFDLTSAAVAGLSDAQIYAVITDGFGTMPAYGHRMVPTERWETIDYVRTKLEGRGAPITPPATP